MDLEVKDPLGHNNTLSEAEGWHIRCGVIATRRVSQTPTKPDFWTQKGRLRLLSGRYGSSF